MLPVFQSPEGLVVCGCDEAGRGCLAGPVVAAATILPKDFYHPLLNDSKVLMPEERDELRIFIEKHAIDYAIGIVSNNVIDEINILQASFLAMHLAIEQLKTAPGYILVDGNRFKAYKTIPHECVIKGDGTYSQIAAASILAKTERDRIMQQLHNDYPHYVWMNNKGYPTPEHREAIRMHGTTPIHRMSFNLLGELEVEEILN